MERTQEIREITIQDLSDIGDLAFDYGEDFIQQGEIEKGNAYKTFSIGALILGYRYDSTKKEIALKIVKFAWRIGDKQVAEQYSKLAER